MAAAGGRLPAMSRRTIPPTHGPSTPKGPTRVHVVETRSGWQVRKEGVVRPSRAYATQAEAVAEARSKLQVIGGELRVQTRDGRSTGAFTLGHTAMAKLAAVEGVTFTPAMKRKLKAARNPTLSPEERRAILLGGLGKARP